MTDKLVARVSFTYLDAFDDKRKAVHRGRTWIDADHELVRRYPDRFGADDTYPARGRWHERHNTSTRDLPHGPGGSCAGAED